MKDQNSIRFSKRTLEAKEGEKKEKTFKNPRENYFQTRTLYSVKFSITHEGGG